MLNGSTNSTNNTDGSRLDDREYYNDLPGKIPPDVPLAEASDKACRDSPHRQPTAAPRNCIKKSNGSEQNGQNLIDLTIDEQPATDNAEAQSEAQQNVKLEHHYVNCSTEDSKIAGGSPDQSSHITPSIKDPFDMRMCNVV